MTDLEGFRDEVRDWCRVHVPTGWREAQTGVSDQDFVAFQKAWFQELRAAGFAVPHWPAAWGGGMTAAEQVILYQELAAADAPRLVLAFVSIHHAASTLLVAGTEEQRQRHLPAILQGEIWCQGFSEPEAGSDLASLRTTARRDGDRYVVNGQKLWASGALHSDWCLLLARTDPDAPKRKGISYFLVDMRSPGVEVRPIRNAVGESHFCEVFLDDVEIPATQLVGVENAGWHVAQQTLGAERGMTMLELAERLSTGFRWLLRDCSTLRTRSVTSPVSRQSLAAAPQPDTVHDLRPRLSARPPSTRSAGSPSSGQSPAAAPRPDTGPDPRPWLPARSPGPAGGRPIDDPVVRDQLARYETELAGLRGLCRSLVERVDTGRAGPADASVVKLYYSELLQRMTGFAAEVAGLDAHTELQKPLSSGWESGAWVLDFIGSWEWTIPGGSSEIQRTIIGERGLGLPREPTST